MFSNSNAFTTGGNQSHQQNTSSSQGNSGRGGRGRGRGCRGFNPQRGLQQPQQQQQQGGMAQLQMVPNQPIGLGHPGFAYGVAQGPFAGNLGNQQPQGMVGGGTESLPFTFGGFMNNPSTGWEQTMMGMHPHQQQQQQQQFGMTWSTPQGATTQVPEDHKMEVDDAPQPYRPGRNFVQKAPAKERRYVPRAPKGDVSPQRSAEAGPSQHRDMARAPKGDGISQQGSQDYAPRRKGPSAKGKGKEVAIIECHCNDDEQADNLTRLIGRLEEAGIDASFIDFLEAGMAQYVVEQLLDERDELRAKVGKLQQSQKHLAEQLRQAQRKRPEPPTDDESAPPTKKVEVLTTTERQERTQEEIAAPSQPVVPTPEAPETMVHPCQ
ncbi:hypothetical protein Hypma_013739 [Hypsizygus marmoreus]|uniref:Uncharacterized protein n=1 Tax=Hypsizygus marmoreus TaxID=39966 RepID=A0A151V5V3_HYPMA|nr:hypothetical protein Hypma_013745 [Hypsizygus marmoreus]RDB19440.1 hypothetical protein Hypma_013739 [Hypsizygus marmoreus]